MCVGTYIPPSTYLVVVRVVWVEGHEKKSERRKKRPRPLATGKQIDFLASASLPRRREPSPPTYLPTLSIYIGGGNILPRTCRIGSGYTHIRAITYLFP